jgi:hypothetical protein
MYVCPAGPSHMSLYLMPHREASLSSWWFGDGTPQLYLAREYFIFYTHGLDAPPWNFWFEIQVLNIRDLRFQAGKAGDNQNWVLSDCK